MTIQKDKILLLFPDGVGIRNYLYSDVFQGVEKDLVLFHAFDAPAAVAVQNITKIEEAFSIPNYKESVKEKFFRELICLARLKHNAKLVDNPIILSNWKTEHKTVKNKLFYKTIAFYVKAITQYTQISKLEKKYQKAIRGNSFFKEITVLLNQIQPTQIFCSHQRGVQCATVFAAAKDLGIKTSTVIYSWDNLPKARMALQADQYLVWSQYMKEELNLYYPEIEEKQIFITGTPQFECYQQAEKIIPKEVFYKRYDLDINKKIICFSGDDVKTSPNDSQYLEDLASELMKSGLAAEYQILLRRCPVDVSGRFEPVVAKYQELIKQAPPLWNFKANSSWTTIYPLPEDVSLLVSTAYYSDVVVNVGSTMAFDFAMFQKPCIYINYDQQNKVNSNWSVKTIYQLQHFRSMPNRECVIWWNKREEISKLLKSGTFSPAMDQWKSAILAEYDNASNKINKIITACTSVS
ncbi:hypothetical protein [Flavobacterium frigoris]|uniref:hypothetical protein n=1 Tax=Flavobacterium frigoris TaxID=229204 RepID=UPI000683546B|nr:hypothetical protein [Flavobacterium frigoris]